MKIGPFKVSSFLRLVGAGGLGLFLSLGGIKMSNWEFWAILMSVGVYTVRGEYYPCKPDIFEQTYEPVV